MMLEHYCRAILAAYLPDRPRTCGQTSSGYLIVLQGYDGPTIWRQIEGATVEVPVEDLDYLNTRLAARESHS